MTQPRIIRPQGSSLVLSVVLWIVAAGLVWPVVTATKPVSQSGGPMTDQAKASVLIASALALYGVFSALSWVNGVLLLDNDGLRLKNLLGQKRYQASWDEITRLEARIQSGAGIGSPKRQYFALHTKSQIVFLREFGNNVEMAEIIRSHAPALADDWRK